MLTIETLFPAPSDAMRAALEAAPRSLMAVNAAINYQQSLALDDPRYESTTQARAEQFEHRFHSRFNYNRATGEFAPPQQGKHVLFFGHVGCGKSTELTQLCHQLHHPDRYWVVRVDLLNMIDPSDARYSDVWLAVAERLVAQLQAEQIPVSDVVLNRLRNWFSERVLVSESLQDLNASVQSEAEVGGGIPFVGKLLAKFTSTIRFGSTHRDTLRTVVQNTYAEFVGAMNLLVAEVTEQLQALGRGQRVLFAIDGTDRFKGDDWRRLFVEDANQLVMVNAIAVYTVPMALKSCGARLDLFETIVLPMIKLHEFSAGRSRREAAYRTLRAIVLKRCHHSLFEDLAALDALITWSGGHLRDALRLLNYACASAETPTLRRADVDAAAQELAYDYRDWLHADHYPVLAAAMRDPDNTGTSDTITMLVERSALLEYNTGSWRLPHPVITLLQGYQRAAAAASTADGSPAAAAKA
ncbi:ATP-binding protein [Pseudaquabacterium rugosum]|uniref:ATP-binding protein n=1 Tax=Pseudaquabacterium rugosum TaxID=2984194 RepID=A0ABU9B4I0_9BURK